MFELIFAAIWAALAQSQVGVYEPYVPPPAPVLFVVSPDDVVPDDVDPVSQAGVVLEDGTVVWEDGSVSCVTASPCAYAAAGLEVPGE
jgi:hypothetical protein